MDALLQAQHDRGRKIEKFEDLEQKMFGRDGFEDAVRRADAIEGELGLPNLASFTAPLPPAPKKK